MSYPAAGHPTNLEAIVSVYKTSRAAMFDLASHWGFDLEMIIHNTSPIDIDAGIEESLAAVPSYPTNQSISYNTILETFVQLHYIITNRTTTRGLQVEQAFWRMADNS